MPSPTLLRWLGYKSAGSDLALPNRVFPKLARRVNGQRATPRYETRREEREQ